MRHTFFCIDGHTAGNPVRLVSGGAPILNGSSMSERRQDFQARFDWIRTGLMLEPRGHDMMSGGFFYPPTLDDSDVGLLFIETSGCLPMCGHGTIGMVTFGIENGLIEPRTPGKLKIEVPAGVLDVEYFENAGRVTSVRIHNVPAYLAAENVSIDVPGFGPLSADVAYGGNYYAIVEPQSAYQGLDALGATRIVELSRMVRELVREKVARSILSTRASAASATFSGQMHRKGLGPMAEMPSSTVKRRSIAARAAPVPPHAWPSWWQKEGWPSATAMCMKAISAASLLVASRPLRRLAGFPVSRRRSKAPPFPPDSTPFGSTIPMNSRAASWLFEECHD